MTIMKYQKVGIVLLLASFFTLNSYAAIYTVTSNADSGTGTLREAITLANSSNQGSEIYFNLPTGSETIIIDSQLPTITTSMDIDGDNNPDSTSDTWKNVTVQVKSGGKYRVFQISPTSSNIVSIEDITIKGGDISSFTSDANGLGGSVYTTSGTLNLTSVTISGSKAYMGGGLHTGGSRNPDKAVVLSNCIITGNSAVWSGGIHAMATGSLKIYNSTITNNTATRYGGGICATINTQINNSLISNNKVTGSDSYGGGITIAGSTTSINNSTISGNTANGGNSYGGGVYCESGTAIINNSTISSNVVSGTVAQGGGIYSKEASSLYLLNCIAVNNSSPTQIDSDINTSGNTFAYYSWLNNVTGQISSQTSAPNIPTAFLTGDILPLADNGGVTKTMAIGTNSPSVKTGTFVYYNSFDGYYFLDQAGASHKLIDWNIKPNVVALDKVTTDQRRLFRPSPASIGAYNPTQGIPPVITKIKPNHSASGNKVKIFGSGLVNTQKIMFGKTEAKISGKAADNKVTVTVPAGTAGQTVDVTISTTQGTTTIMNGFTYKK